MKPLFLLIALAMPLAAQAQYQPDALQSPSETMTDEEAIRSTIEALFDGMRASDSSAVAAVFHENATLQSVFVAAPGTYQMQQGEIDSFVTSIGSTPAGALDEKLGKVEIQIDAGLAHAWMDYEFHFQGQLSHCGVNSMQLVKMPSGDWQILNVVDTRRRDCE